VDDVVVESDNSVVDESDVDDEESDIELIPVAPVAFESGVIPDDVGFSAVSSVETATDSDAAEVDAEAAAQEAHADAAKDAQAAADDFIEKGDYAAAAEAREMAENEAWEAGDTSMLSA